MDNNTKDMVARSLNNPKSLTDEERDVIATQWMFYWYNGVRASWVDIIHKGKRVARAVKNKLYNTEYNINWI